MVKTIARKPAAGSRGRSSASPQAPAHDDAVEEIWPRAAVVAPLPGHCRLLLLDPHPVVRAGIAALLSQQADLQIVGHAAGNAEARRVLATETVDLIITELPEAQDGGIESLAVLRSLCPTARILVLTGQVADSPLTSALANGATSYLTKNASPELLLEAVRATHAGRQFIDPSLIRSIVDASVRRSQPPLKSGTLELSEQERQLLTLVAQGASKRRITRELNCPAQVVEERRTACMQRLGLTNLDMLVSFALHRGLISDATASHLPDAALARQSPVRAAGWDG